MKIRGWALLTATALGSLAIVNALSAGDKPDSLYFSGRLIEVNPATNTFVIRSKKKDLVFTIDVGRCDVTTDGSISERTLRWAKPGDAVLGELSLSGAKTVVTWVEFTHDPQFGKPVPSKPGYILTPYKPRYPEPWHHPLPMDARTLSHGDMVLDDISGKIFLVP